MTEWYIALPATILIIALSAGFVILEFSLLAARRHRLEETAETSAASRAGLRSMNELTIMLAGAQLGITVCTFALGAITKPWVHDAMMPLFELLPVPTGVADAISFLISLFVVTFLHLVIGEMAPKSWAIAHPESALRFIALPARWFIALFRPLLSWINRMANRLVEKAGQKPVERAAARGYDAETLQSLVEHSRLSGALDHAAASQITGVIELERSTVGEVVEAPENAPVTLPSTSSVGDVQRVARESGKLRILLDDSTWVEPRVVHVRDTLLAPTDSPAVEQSRSVLTLSAETTLQQALDRMRMENEQLAAVVPVDGDSPVLGVVTWEYILDQLWPTIERELDRVQAQREN